MNRIKRIIKGPKPKFIPPPRIKIEEPTIEEEILLDISIDDIIHNFVYNLSISKIDEERYGNRHDVELEIETLLYQLTIVLDNLSSYITPSHLIVFDSAGIGDVVHSRLVVQNLAQVYKQIAWIIPPISVSIYKHDLLVETLPGIYNRFRNPGDPMCVKLASTIATIIQKTFPNNKIINIPDNVCSYLQHNRLFTFPSTWFASSNLNQNKSIKHELTHYGQINNLPFHISKKYLLIEHSSITYNDIDLTPIQNLIDKLKDDYNIDSVYLGSPNDPPFNNAIDARGLDLYSTITLIKNCSAFLCRTSGNTCLTVFADNINVFEISDNKTVSLTSCPGYTEHNKFRKTSINTLYDDLTKFLKPKYNKAKVVTLFQFCGAGDTLMTTWAPKLIKERINIKVNYAVKKSHEQFLINNPYIDDIIIVPDNVAKTNRTLSEPNLFENELNLWCGCPKRTNVRPIANWQITEEIARNISSFFNSDIITHQDNLLPQLFFSQEEKRIATDFYYKNAPYIILESEYFSGQLHSIKNPKPEDILSTIANNINPNINIFTSSSTPIPEPFKNLIDLPLTTIALIIENAYAFLGLGSGMSVISTERTLKLPYHNLIAYEYGVNWLKYLQNFKDLNIQIIQPKNMFNSFIDLINSINSLKYDYDQNRNSTTTRNKTRNPKRPIRKIPRT